MCEGYCSPESQRRKDARSADDNSQKSSAPGASCDTTGGKPGASSKKAAGGQNFSNLSLNLKYDVLEFLQRNKKVEISAVAEKFGIEDRTARRIRQDKDKIKERLYARLACGTAKSLKLPTFPEVRAAHTFHFFPYILQSKQERYVLYVHVHCDRSPLCQHCVILMHIELVPITLYLDVSLAGEQKGSRHDGRATVYQAPGQPRYCASARAEG